MSSRVSHQHCSGTNLRVEQKVLVEVDSVNAHGDGAAEIAVQALDFCPHRRLLVSVGQGTNGIKLWDVTTEGKLLNWASEFVFAHYIPSLQAFWRRRLLSPILFSLSQDLRYSQARLQAPLSLGF